MSFRHQYWEIDNLCVGQWVAKGHFGKKKAPRGAMMSSFLPRADSGKAARMLAIH